MALSALADAHLEAAGPQFDPHTEPHTCAERWRYWIRNLNYYLDGQVGLSLKQKLSRLLHQAGPYVQDIYETLSDQVVSAESKDDYERAVNKLTEYFVPKLNTAYERQKFRSLEFKREETTAQFVTKLRKQSQYCDFKDKDEYIRDQLIEKCMYPDLKRKWLRKTLDITEMLDMARVYELENYTRLVKIQEPVAETIPEPMDSVNAIETKCYRCDRRGHIASSPTCTAINAECKKCGLRGHFAQVCKTKKGKKEAWKKKIRRIRYVVREETESEDSDSCNKDSTDQDVKNVYSVFKVDCSTDKCELLLRQNKIPSYFIIDSGAAINIVDKKFYKKLVKSGSSCDLTKTHLKFYAYGGKEIPNLGIFKIDVYCPMTKTELNNVEILVYDGIGPCLLSKNTSIDLNMLRKGPINTVICNLNTNADSI
ncbi:unnamed protein product, partial [Brenthis ino]